MKERKLIGVKNDHCEFYDKECIIEECPAYSYRLKTDYEVGIQMAQDIPLTSRYIERWCTKYNKQINLVMVFADVEE